MKAIETLFTYIQLSSDPEMRHCSPCADSLSFVARRPHFCLFFYFGVRQICNFVSSYAYWKSDSGFSYGSDQIHNDSVKGVLELR